MEPNYLFETHHGVSTLTDTTTGIVLEWKNGSFNDSQKTYIDGMTVAVDTKGEAPEAFFARRMREMSEYVAENYPELV